MKIASYNVNSIKARLPRILHWFDEAKPDVCVMQEIKCIDENFPRLEFEERGYHIETFGQKTYNGVALLSKYPVEDVIRGVPGFEDEQSRYIEALIVPDDTDPVRIGGLYLPNGNPAPGPKYDYKLAWMEAFHAHARDLLVLEESTVLCGDYNVIAEPEGCHDPAAWAEDALFRLETRQAFRSILNMGYTEALKHLKGPNFYTFWDYQGGAWDQDKGVRIDHLLLSPQATDRLKGGDADRATREPNTGPKSAKPSDHVPVWVEIE